MIVFQEKERACLEKYNASKPNPFAYVYDSDEDSSEKITMDAKYDCAVDCLFVSFVTFSLIFQMKCI